MLYTIINDYFTSIGILFFNIIYICFSHYFNRFLCWDVCLSDDSQHFNEYFVSFQLHSTYVKLENWKYASAVERLENLHTSYVKELDNMIGLFEKDS